MYDKEYEDLCITYRAQIDKLTKEIEELKAKMLTKTFVAEGVLCDYTCGMVVIKAKTKKEAKKIIEKTFGSEETQKEVYEGLCTLKEGEISYTYGGG